MNAQNMSNDRTPLGDLIHDLKDVENARLFGAADAKAEFAVILSNARRLKGLTQQELADKSGVTQPFIAKLEGGEANPTLGEIGSLLAVIGLRLKMAAKPIGLWSRPWSRTHRKGKLRQSG